jgi:hypothetical protein
MYKYYVLNAKQKTFFIFLTLFPPHQIKSYVALHEMIYKTAEV